MKKPKVKDKMKLKSIEKSAITYAIHKDTLYTHLCILDRPRSLSDVKACKWTETKSLPFALMMFRVVFLIADKYLKLSTQNKAIFWKRYGEAQDVFNNLSIHYHRDLIAAHLCNYFDGIRTNTGQAFDPLQLALDCKKFAGPLIKLHMPIINKKVSSSPAPKRWKPWGEAENCVDCKSRSCGKAKHKRYWINKNKFKP